jgi:hypothetical protein
VLLIVKGDAYTTPAVARATHVPEIGAKKAVCATF